ncbi:MAG: hypothetical protein ABW131_17115 [Candidatus Sedimenticola sp. 6PFRAG5]
MIFAVKITGFPKADGDTLFEMAPQWWNAKDLIKDERFLESRQRGYYRDYAAELSPEEMRELHVRYRNNGGALHKLLCFRFRKFSPSCKKMHDALFKRADRFSHFHISVVELEPGL